MRLLCLCLVIASCGSGTYLNLKPQSFSNKPQNIIWLQVAGLGVTHLGALRFGLQNDQDFDRLQSYTCLGVTWPQSFSHMRPDTYLSMNAQIVGSKSMNGSCEDYQLTPFWDRIVAQTKKVVVLEVGASRQRSLEQEKKCEVETEKESKKKEFLENVAVLKMGSSFNSGDKSFHYRKTFPKGPGTFIDSGCQSSLAQKSCMTTPFENIRYGIENVFSKKNNGIFLVRDFHYQTLIEQKKYKKAFLYLERLLSAINLAGNLPSPPANLTTLISGAGSAEIEFPRSEKSWRQLLRGNNTRVFRYKGLQSIALAKGASAENFCGSFDDSTFVQRLFFHATREVPVSEYLQGFLQWL